MTLTSSSPNKDLIKAHYDATINNFNPQLIRQQVAPDFLDHASGALGPEAVVTHIEATLKAFPDMKVTIDEIVEEGVLLAVRATWSGTHCGAYMGFEATQKYVTFTGMVFWRIEQGQIKERWAVLDAFGLTKQLNGEK